MNGLLEKIFYAIKGASLKKKNIYNKTNNDEFFYSDW
jgi:hypothetical protein